MWSFSAHSPFLKGHRRLCCCCCCCCWCRKNLWKNFFDVHCSIFLRLAVALLSVWTWKEAVFYACPLLKSNQLLVVILKVFSCKITHWWKTSLNLIFLTNSSKLCRKGTAYDFTYSSVDKWHSLTLVVLVWNVKEK